MNCDRCSDLLQDVLDGRLDGTRADEVRAHVSTCTDCAREQEELEKLHALFNAVPATPAPPDFAAGVAASLAGGGPAGAEGASPADSRENDGVGSLRRFPGRLGWIVAAAAALLIAVALGSRLAREPTSSTPQTTATGGESRSAVSDSDPFENDVAETRDKLRDSAFPERTGSRRSLLPAKNKEVSRAQRAKDRQEEEADEAPGSTARPAPASSPSPGLSTGKTPAPDGNSAEPDFGQDPQDSPAPQELREAVEKKIDEARKAAGDSTGPGSAGSGDDGAALRFLWDREPGETVIVEFDDAEAADRFTRAIRSVRLRRGGAHGFGGRGGGSSRDGSDGDVPEDEIPGGAAPKSDPVRKAPAGGVAGSGFSTEGLAVGTVAQAVELPFESRSQVLELAKAHRGRIASVKGLQDALERLRRRGVGVPASSEGAKADGWKKSGSSPQFDGEPERVEDSEDGDDEVPDPETAADEKSGVPGETGRARGSRSQPQDAPSDPAALESRRSARKVTVIVIVRPARSDREQ